MMRFSRFIELQPAEAAKAIDVRVRRSKQAIDRNRLFRDFVFDSKARKYPAEPAYACS
jgi:hypothetical protein